MTRALDVLSFGEALVDFFPDPPVATLREAERFRRHLGGAPSNVAVGLARLGCRVGLMSQVGADEFGVFVRAALEAEGVDTTGLGTHPTVRTGITFVAVGERGERSFTFYRHPSADQAIGPGDIDTNVISRARVFHFGSSTFAREPARSATRRALELARAAGCVVSCDPNLRPHLWERPADAQPLLAEALGLTDIVKVSDDELAPLLGGPVGVEEGARALRALGPGLVLVTLGERGCYFDGGAAGTGYSPGFPVETVDTTGAGDGFVAGLLCDLLPALAAARPAELAPATLEAACAFANRVAARVVTRLGATAALPRRHELL